MANCITRYIPNTLTCLNLFSGCVAAVMAFQFKYDLALLFIVIGAVFDFFDGLAARALNAHSVIGKDLDSLADDICFGLAPSVVVFSLFREMPYPEWMSGVSAYFPYLAFLIAVFSGLRLAKFNNDTRQTTSFVGLPVPANALFWASLAVGAHATLTGGGVHPLALLAMVCVSSWLLVSEIPMFSLKFKDLSWAHNKLRFLFLLVCVVFLAVWQVQGLAVCIVWYVLLSILTARKSA